MSVLCLLVSECITTLVTGAQEVQNRLLNFLERVTQGHKPPCEWWEASPCPLQDHQVLLTTDPFLHIPDCLYVFVFTWVQCPWRPEGIGSRISMTVSCHADVREHLGSSALPYCIGKEKRIGMCGATSDGFFSLVWILEIKLSPLPGSYPFRLSHTV